MFKEDIEWFIKKLVNMRNELYIDAAWKDVPIYNGFTGITVDTEDTETHSKDKKERERKLKFLNVEIKKWQAQLDFHKEKEQC